MDFGRGTVKMARKYTEKELKYILDNYHTMSNSEIGKHIGLTMDAIRSKLRRLGVRKTDIEIKKIYQNNKHKCAHHGKNHPLFGTHRPYELRKKLSNLYKGKTFEELHGEIEAKKIKEKISIGNIGKIPWNKGLSANETCIHYKNNKFPNTGKKFGPMSEESKRKISIANTGKIRSEDTKKRLSELLIKSKASVLEKNSNWQGGKSFEIYPREFNKMFKFIVKQRDGFLCLKCGMRNEDSKILFKTGLNVHHINYDKTLNLIENCCCLCRRCHSETNFNRPHWIKFFQSMLTERYNYRYDTEGNIIQIINLEKMII